MIYKSGFEIQKFDWKFYAIWTIDVLYIFITVNADILKKMSNFQLYCLNVIMYTPLHSEVQLSFSKRTFTHLLCLCLYQFLKLVNTEQKPLEIFIQIHLLSL